MVNLRGLLHKTTFPTALVAALCGCGRSTLRNRVVQYVRSPLCETVVCARRNFIMFTQEGIRAHPGVTSYSNNDECQEQLLKIAKVITRQTSLYCIVCAIFSLLSDGCFHTTQELLGACGLHSPRQLQSALEAMAPMGLIIIERRQSNHYRFSHVAFPLGRP